MSLKIEQCLDELEFAEREPRIYTTGAFLVPMKIKIGTKERFVWVVDAFNDETYLHGELCDPAIYANNSKNLLQ